MIMWLGMSEVTPEPQDRPPSASCLIENTFEVNGGSGVRIEMVRMAPINQMKKGSICTETIFPVKSN